MAWSLSEMRNEVSHQTFVSLSFQLWLNKPNTIWYWHGCLFAVSFEVCMKFHIFIIWNEECKVNVLSIGMALSNFTLTVSEHCSLEQLPAAFGWHMIGKAVFVTAFGPLIGKSNIQIHLLWKNWSNFNFVFFVWRRFNSW